MRADVNLSVREVGSTEFGTRTETKNLNSFSAISRAIEAERDRQIDLIESGEAVIQETRRWDDNKAYSYAMRSKEDAQDYRYFPDPDLVPLNISDEWLGEIRSRQPEFKTEKWHVMPQSMEFLNMTLILLRIPRNLLIFLRQQHHFAISQRKFLTGFSARQ